MRKRAPKRPAHERRRLILEGAQSAFASSGYAKTAAVDVARAAGVSAPALYRYFPSKKDLYVSTLKAAEARLLNIWQRIIDEHDDPLDAIWNVGTGYYDHTETRSPIMRMWFKALAEADDPDVREALAHSFASLVDLLEETLKRGRERGVVDEDIDTRVAAWHFMVIGLTFDLIHLLGLDGEELKPRRVTQWGKLYMRSVRKKADGEAG